MVNNPLQNWLVRNFFIWLERITAKKTTKLIFVSHANKDRAEKLKIGKKEQFLVIRSGVLIEYGKQLSTETLKNEKEKRIKLVGNVSCFKPQKGLHNFIEACRQLKEKNSNYGFNLSVWDRAFGTYWDQPHKGHTAMVIGLSQFRDEKKLTLPWLLILPITGDPGRQKINRQ